MRELKADFTINEIPVHSALLKEIWPFFKTASSVDMSEKKSQSLILPYEKASVKKLVGFFYGRKLGYLNWDTATDLLSMSAVYDIPGLKQVALNTLCTEGMVNCDEAIKARKVAEDNGYVDIPLAYVLEKHEWEINDASGVYSEDQLLELFEILECQ